MAFMGILLINAVLWIILIAVLVDFLCLVALIVFLILSKKYSNKKWIRITRNVVGIIFVLLSIPLIILFLWMKPDKKVNYQYNTSYINMNINT